MLTLCIRCYTPASCETRGEGREDLEHGDCDDLVVMKVCYISPSWSSLAFVDAFIPSELPPSIRDMHVVNLE